MARAVDPRARALQLGSASAGGSTTGPKATVPGSASTVTSRVHVPSPISHRAVRTAAPTRVAPLCRGSLATAVYLLLLAAAERRR